VPYVAPGDAPNLPAVDVEAVRARMGPPPWRAPLIGTDQTRSALIGWPAGYRSVPHYHPHGDETFFVIHGRARFFFDDRAPVDAHPGSLLLATVGQLHAIEAIDELVFLASIAPNVDLPDETIEVPD
jgi:quercetin dioxygenase-like cupin family protein